MSIFFIDLCVMLLTDSLHGGFMSGLEKETVESSHHAFYGTFEIALKNLMTFMFLIAKEIGINLLLQSRIYKMY